MPFVPLQVDRPEAAVPRPPRRLERDRALHVLREKRKTKGLSEAAMVRESLNYSWGMGWVAMEQCAQHPDRLDLTWFPRAAIHSK